MNLYPQTACNDENNCYLNLNIQIYWNVMHIYVYMPTFWVNLCFFWICHREIFISGKKGKWGIWKCERRDLVKMVMCRFHIQSSLKFISSPLLVPHFALARMPSLLRPQFPFIFLLLSPFPSLQKMHLGLHWRHLLWGMHTPNCQVCLHPFWHSVWLLHPLSLIAKKMGKL